ncbi:MAG: hypothetical protein JST26_06525 [Bacteroidetes bacterium]|nr:hypothetical protein [Bacteroidota bacterium]
MRKIYAIPGLGTDERLYRFIHVANTELVVLQWPEPPDNISLEEYARLFIPQINQQEPYYLLGVSFGGMICSELSKILHPQKTILISSSKCRSELPRFLRFFSHVAIHRLIPESEHRRMARMGRWFLGFQKNYMHEFMSMIHKMPPNYFRNCIDCIVKWKSTDYNKNIVHIHGDADRLLLYKCVKANYTIKGGTHAMVINRAMEINHILEKELNG